MRGTGHPRLVDADGLWRSEARRTPSRPPGQSRGLPTRGVCSWMTGYAEVTGKRFQLPNCRRSAHNPAVASSNAVSEPRPTPVTNPESVIAYALRTLHPVSSESRLFDKVQSLHVCQPATSETERASRPHKGCGPHRQTAASPEVRPATEIPGVRCHRYGQKHDDVVIPRMLP